MEILTTQETASYLKISERTLAYYRANGGGPAHSRIFTGGRGVRYRRADLDAWVSEHVVNGERAA
ncbi:MAG: helix-turn-helix domain-containing protein [Novosphingobium sp.]